MNPPPITTARRCGFTNWIPEYLNIPARNVVPPSTHSRIVRASGTVRTWKIPGRSMPGRGGRTDGAPGDSTSLSYDSVVTSPVLTFFRSTVFFFGEMETASQFVRASMRCITRNSCSFATRRLDSCGITPETWYGSPQFAYETYGPRSTMRISAFSSSLRRRAAHDAPPATPPTMRTFMIHLPFQNGRSTAIRAMRDKSFPQAPRLNLMMLQPLFHLQTRRPRSVLRGGSRWQARARSRWRA